MEIGRLMIDASEHAGSKWRHPHAVAALRKARTILLSAVVLDELNCWRAAIFDQITAPGLECIRFSGRIGPS